MKQIFKVLIYTVLLHTFIGCSSKVSGIERLIKAQGLSVKSQVFIDEIGLKKAITNSHLTKICIMFCIKKVIVGQMKNL